MFDDDKVLDIFKDWFVFSICLTTGFYNDVSFIWPCCLGIILIKCLLLDPFILLIVPLYLFFLFPCF
tara:strand:+ start:3230 stop:3430 length:201 start_codon:yes stop_codon:yes gene_type:complete